MTDALYTSRRVFLACTAVALTGASVPAVALTAQHTRMFSGRPALVLHQAHDTHAVAFANEFARAGFATLALTDDPVRQWRDGLARLALEERFVLLGLGNWSDYVVLRGLTAEQRRYPMFELQLRRMADSAWARQHARDLLMCAAADDPRAALRNLSRAAECITTTSSFSWII